MANEVKVLNQQALEKLCRAIKGVANVGEKIDDNNIATDSTYSSFKIEKELEGLETELYDYMNTALAGLNKLTKEIIDDVALVVKDNVLYLYKDPDDTENTYMQMMLINGIAVELGTTEVNLDEYVTKTELESELGTETLDTTSQTVKGAINELFTSVTNVEECLDEIIAKIYYVNPSVTSFTCNPSRTAYEMGEKVASVTFTWTYNKDMVSQTLTGCDLADETVRTATYSTEFNSNKTFTLSASDGTNSTSANKAFTFQNKVHSGSASIPATYDSAFILSLNGALKGSKSGTYTVNVDTNQYFYIAMPTSYNNSDVLTGKVGGFDTDFGKVATVSHTNASGYTCDYNIYKSTNHSLGSISFII